MELWQIVKKKYGIVIDKCKFSLCCSITIEDFYQSSALWSLSSCRTIFSHNLIKNSDQKAVRTMGGNNENKRREQTMGQCKKIKKKEKGERRTMGEIWAR